MTSGYPNQIVAIDFVGPLPQTPRGNRYILVMVDLFTKWCEAVPLPSSDASTTARQSSTTGLPATAPRNSCTQIEPATSRVA